MKFELVTKYSMESESVTFSSSSDSYEAKGLHIKSRLYGKGKSSKRNTYEDLLELC